MLSLTVLDNKTQGFVIYRGPSLINGKPITVVVTALKRSKNEKTGDMVQVYILANIKPTTAVYSGDDEAVCGDCIHRYVGGTGSCYVNPAHGPLGIFKGLENNSYQYVTPEQAGDEVAGRIIRLGAYGDPAAVPIEVWDALLAKAEGWTGYTHQWRRGFAQPHKRYCMASCESIAHRQHAQRKGWRTFRIRADAADALAQGEFQCPASAEEGKRLQCEQCGACSGGEAQRASVAIIVHGTNWKVVRMRKMMDRMKRKQKIRNVKWSKV